MEINVKLNGMGQQPDRATLANIPTSALLRELSRREGVKITTAEPYQNVQVQVNGPAVVLEVFD